MWYPFFRHCDEKEFLNVAIKIYTTDRIKINGSQKLALKSEPVFFALLKLALSLTKIESAAFFVKEMKACIWLSFHSMHETIVWALPVGML